MKKLKLPLNETVIGTVETGLGWVSFAVTPKGLRECRFMFPSSEIALGELLKSVDKEKISDNKNVLSSWTCMFKDYFNGSLKSFDNVPLDSDHWTYFQKRVYMTVQSIPYGKTASYGTIASYLGNGNASRAVGNALKNNPVPPVIPCHRVIAADKDMCGFSATGGIELKLKILELEKDNQ